jgi:hypothetical protein
MLSDILFYRRLILDGLSRDDLKNYKDFDTELLIIS